MNKVKKTLYEQNENIHRDKKELKINPSAENYNNWNENSERVKNRYRQLDESVNSVRRWASLKYRKKKDCTEPEVPLGQHQVDQHAHFGSLRNRKRKGKRLFEEVMSPNCQNLIRDINIQEP